MSLNSAYENKKKFRQLLIYFIIPVSFIFHLLNPNLIITENFTISEIFAPIGLIVIDNQQYFYLILIGESFFRALVHAHILVQLR